jgi:hypothetical protein
MALCPICEHPLPEMSAGRCPNCGAEVVASEALEPYPAPLQAPAPPPWSAPPPPLEEASRDGGGTPWDDRERLGFPTALVDTTRQVLTRPADFFRGMPVASGIGSPLLYGVILAWLGAVAAGFYSALFHSIVGTGLAEALTQLLNPGAVPASSPFAGVMEGWGGFALQVVFGAVFAAIGIVIWAGVLHLALLLLGGAQRGFEATLRVVSFSQAASIVLLVPFCGQLAGPLWALVLYVIGLAEAQRIGYGKAIGAVLLPLLLLCCCCGAVLGLVFLGAAGLAAQLR